jgi:hypothetical protein
MKKFIYVAAMMALSASAVASNYCESSSKVAEQIMINRQMGTALADMLRILPNDSSRDYIKTKVFEAYAVPRFNMPVQQIRIIKDFTDYALLQCLKTVN